MKYSICEIKKQFLFESLISAKILYLYRCCDFSSQNHGANSNCLLLLFKLFISISQRLRTRGAKISVFFTLFSFLFRIYRYCRRYIGFQSVASNIELYHLYTENINFSNSRDILDISRAWRFHSIFVLLV